MGKTSKAGKRRVQQKALSEVQVRTPIRHTMPDRVVAYLGPTNSGKTYQAMQELIQNGRGVYAAPLRMLAREAYGKLSQELGADQVGLRTGEESINQDAPIMCVTTEMAPMRGELLVLDEVHWAADSTRGWAWSRLLAGADYKQMVLLGSGDVLPMLQACFGEHLQLSVHERLGPLEWIGDVRTDQLQAGDAVIAYSRRSVLHAAKEIAEQYGAKRVSLLYGAMPLASRIDELERLRSGEADILVATDVLGHGMNLPLRRVLFSETEKWDGEKLRSLDPWEAGQVAGRAGRYGIYPGGEVGVLYGLTPYDPTQKTVRAGLKPSIQTNQEPPLWAFSIIRRGRLRPQLEDLGQIPGHLMRRALEAWDEKAARELLAHPWLRAEDTAPIKDRLGIIGSRLSSEIDHLPLQELWTLATGPVDPDDHADLLGEMAWALLGSGELQNWLEQPVASMDLEEAEEYAQIASTLRWFSERFPGVGGIRQSRAARAEQEAAARVTKLLQQLLQS